MFQSAEKRGDDGVRAQNTRPIEKPLVFRALSIPLYLGCDLGLGVGDLDPKFFRPRDNIDSLPCRDVVGNPAAGGLPS